MPTIESYESLSPFTLEEIVAAVNSVLRDQPSLKIQGRTVRFYISNNLLPPPQGGPKFARYSMEHLLRIVAIRRWMDEGISLEQAARRIQAGEHGGKRDAYPNENSRSRQKEAAPQNLAPESTGKAFNRIQLTQHLALEVADGADLELEIMGAIDALFALRKTI